MPYFMVAILAFAMSARIIAARRTQASRGSATPPRRCGQPSVSCRREHAAKERLEIQALRTLDHHRVVGPRPAGGDDLHALAGGPSRAPDDVEEFRRVHQPAA